MDVDISKDKSKYEEFYEIVGRDYPESLLVHASKDEKSRFMAVMRILEPFAVRGKTLLDVGCNDGVYTIPYAMIAHVGGNAHGIDISRSLIYRATQKSEKLKLSNATFEVADIEDFVCSQKYDVILMSEVIEHLINPDKAFLNIGKCLRHDGIFILTAPTPLFEIEKLYERVRINFSYYRKLLKRELRENQMIRSSNNLLAQYGIGGYIYPHHGYLPLGLKDYCGKFGFKCLGCYTIGYSHISRIASIKAVELTMRKTPLLNLMGQTNIIIMRK